MIKSENGRVEINGSIYDVLADASSILDAIEEQIMPVFNKTLEENGDKPYKSFIELHQEMKEEANTIGLTGLKKEV